MIEEYYIIIHNFLYGGVKYLEIRYINEYDNKMEISEIYEKSWRYAYKDIIPQEFLDSIEKGKWIPIFDFPDWSIVVCIENSKYIGTISFSKSRFQEYFSYGEIISFYILPEYIGKGYGNKILKYVIKELYGLGYSQLLLWVLEDNYLAKKFYKKNGFIETDNYMVDNIGGKELKEVMFIYKNEDMLGNYK